MESRVNYTAVGVFVVLLGLALVALVYWLTEGVTRKVYDTYLVYALDSVSGLNQNAAVRFRGVDVGRVARIELDRQHPERVRLYLDIEEGVPITRDTVARLQMQGITGLLLVDLSVTGKDLTPLTPAPDEKYPVIAYEHALFAKLDDGVSGIMVTLSTLSQRLEALFSEQNVDAISETLSHVNALSETLANRREDIAELVRASRETAENAARLSAQGETVLRDGQQLMRDGQVAARNIALVAERMTTTLEKVEAAADSVKVAGGAASDFTGAGAATLERMKNESLPDFERLMDEMQYLSRELTMLIAEIRDDPSQLITGGPRYKPGPGE